MQVFLTPSALKHIYWPKSPKEFDAIYTKPHNLDHIGTNAAIITFNDEAQELCGHSSAMCEGEGFNSFDKCQPRSLTPICNLDFDQILQQLKFVNDQTLNPNEPHGISLYRTGKLCEFMDRVFGSKWPSALTSRTNPEWMLWPTTFKTAAFMSRLKLRHIPNKDARISIGPINPSFKSFTLRLCSFSTNQSTIVELPAFSVKRI